MVDVRTTEGLTHLAFEWTRDQHRPCVGTRGHCTDKNPDGCGGFLRAGSVRGRLGVNQPQRSEHPQAVSDLALLLSIVHQDFLSRETPTVNNPRQFQTLLPGSNITWVPGCRCDALPQRLDCRFGNLLGGTLLQVEQP